MQEVTAGDGTRSDRIAMSGAISAALIVGCAVVGLVLALLLPSLTSWVLTLPWAPMKGPLMVLSRITDAVPGWLPPVVGAVLGAAAGAVAVSQAVTITVNASEIVMTKGSSRSRWSRAQVHEAVVERRHLSLRDERDADLVRETIEGEAKELAEALRRHSWPVRTQP